MNVRSGPGTHYAAVGQVHKNTSIDVVEQKGEWVRILPPLPDPDAILMAARNYEEHANEMAQAGRTSGTTSVIDEKVLAGIPGLWNRHPGDRRGNP